jgi:hypothetical protein
MNNPENYKQVPCCRNCSSGKGYIAGDRYQIECIKIDLYSHALIDRGDEAPDYVCGDHPDLRDFSSHRQAPCCENCTHNVEYWKTGLGEYRIECKEGAKNKDDFTTVKPDHRCDEYQKA